MHLPIFLSHPKEFTQGQKDFMVRIKAYLASRKIEPRTLGVSDYDAAVPLHAVRRMLHECHGVLAIALRRYSIDQGAAKPGTVDEMPIRKIWFTSPWVHMESAMAYQMGLPILIFREKGVHGDGMLDKGSLDMYLPECDVNAPFDEYFASGQWTDLINEWESRVRSVARNRAAPPRLY
jgi:hypothetical protein